MPYKDIEKRRAYDRERKRKKRAKEKAEQNKPMTFLEFKEFLKRAQTFKQKPQKPKYIDKSLFDDTALSGDKLEQHHLEADTLEDFLKQPEPRQPRERYKWQEHLNEQIEKLEPKQESEPKKEDEESEKSED